MAWARDLGAAMRPYSSGVYVNFLTAEEGRDRVQSAYGEQVLGRLAVLKRKFDPQNLFRHNKPIDG